MKQKILLFTLGVKLFLVKLFSFSASSSISAKLGLYLITTLLLSLPIGLPFEMLVIFEILVGFTVSAN